VPPRAPDPMVSVNGRDLQTPDLAARQMNRLWQEMYGLLAAVREIAARPTGSTGAPGVTITEQERDTIRAISIGSTDNPVASQKPVVPSGDALPPVSTSTNGELFKLTTDGIIYIFDGTALEWVEIGAAAAAHSILSATHGDSVAAAAVLGDLIYANSTPAWQRLAGSIVASKRWLRQTGNGAISAAPAWDQPASADLSDSSNVPLKNGANVFTGSNTFGTIVLGGELYLGSATGAATISSASSPYTVPAGVSIVYVNTSTGAVTVKMPTPVVLYRSIWVVDVTGNAAANNITLDGNGANINTVATIVLNTGFVARLITATGTNYNILAGFA
jgi:hypothetical protein